MSVFIRFCCVKLIALLLIYPWAGFSISLNFPVGEEVSYVSLFKIESGLTCNGHLVSSCASQELTGTLTNSEIEFQNFPVSLQFTIDDLKFSAIHQGQSIIWSLDKPGSFIELNELKSFRGIPLKFSLIENPPFIEFPNEWLKHYGDLKIFRYPILTGLFGDDLYFLFELSKHPLKVGEKFEVTIEKTDKQPYRTVKTVFVKEILSDQIILEVLTLIERERVTLPSGQAIVHGQSKAIWDIARTNSLKFKMQEKGTLTQTVLVEEIESQHKHAFEREIHTSIR